MTKRSLKKSIEDDFKDLMEFGVSKEDFLNIRESNQRTNLKKLKTILTETSILVEDNIRTLAGIIYTLEKCLFIGRVTDQHRESIENGVDEFKGSLFDLIWNVDNVLNVVDYGHFFREEKNVAELKVIQIVEIINEASNSFDGLKISGVNLAYEQITIIIDALVQVNQLFNGIKGIYEDL